MTSHVHCIIGKVDTGWLYQVIGRTISGLGMKAQYASSWTTPTCIIIMINATSNVAVAFPAIPRLPSGGWKR
jgi:hypothetical protein